MEFFLITTYIWLIKGPGARYKIILCQHGERKQIYKMFT